MPAQKHNADEAPFLHLQGRDLPKDGTLRSALDPNVLLDAYVWTATQHPAASNNLGELISLPTLRTGALTLTAALRP